MILINDNLYLQFLEEGDSPCKSFQDNVIELPLDTFVKNSTEFSLDRKTFHEILMRSKDATDRIRLIQTTR